jgi:hypothetical protein
MQHALDFCIICEKTPSQPWTPSWVQLGASTKLFSFLSAQIFDSTVFPYPEVYIRWQRANWTLRFAKIISLPAAQTPNAPESCRTIERCYRTCSIPGWQQ